MAYNKTIISAKGKYIIYLKDVSIVHKGWLSYLLKIIVTDEKIGMVGSKLINENHTLIEAGGILWKNGEYARYGKGNIPDRPEYNYVKEVDYLSGFSIIFKKHLYQKIGGFSIIYNDSLYKYIDFALELRKLGYKIMYQPKSIVEINDNNYNQIDANSPDKEIYKKLFIKRWEKDLKEQYEKEDIFLARDRGHNESKIFVIDRFVPNFDKDAGGRCSFMYLNIFKEIGLKVTFLGDLLYQMEPYTTILQQNGIEVLYGDYYKNPFMEEWLKKNLKYFKYIYLQRPDITIKYIELIKNYSSAKIFYFAHDLHYLRFLREYNITHDIKKFEESEKFKKIEMEIFNKVDVIYVVGTFESNLLKNIFKNQKIVRNIPLYIYEEKLDKIEKDFSKRKNLIYVGGFSHSPNIDGILWFLKEIYPKIIEKYPDIVLHIIGQDIPEFLKNLESKNLKIEGYLNDIDLKSLYLNCRIAIAPLRFGAGIKGKVIEAAYYQIPMVTTTIGGEGLDSSIGAFIMEDNPKYMADIIINLYTDYSKLKNMSESGKLFINKYFTKNNAKNIISKDLV